MRSESSSERVSRSVERNDLSLDWKTEKMMDGESEDTERRWSVVGEVNHGESELDEVDWIKEEADLSAEAIVSK